MNTSANKIYWSPKTVFQTAFLFVLAVMLLVVSCPLKRVLQNEFTAGPSSPVRTNQTNINQASASDYYTIADGCWNNQKVIVTTFNLSQQVSLSASINLSYIPVQPGFDIHYSLSRIKNKDAYVVSFNTSSLPLYLQQLRLRI